MAFLSRLSPWSALTDLERQMDSLMKGVFGTGGFEALRPQRTGGAWVPAVDVFSREADLVVRAELPGVDPEKDVDITVTDGVLRIRGQRRSEHRDERENYFRMETTYGSFERSIPLPEGVDVEGIKATHRNGVLEVVVPGAAQIAPAKRIPVQVEGGAAQPAIEAQAGEAAPAEKAEGASAGESQAA